MRSHNIVVNLFAILVLVDPLWVHGDPAGKTIRPQVQTRDRVPHGTGEPHLHGIPDGGAAEGRDSSNHVFNDLCNPDLAMLLEKEDESLLRVVRRARSR